MKPIPTFLRVIQGGLPPPEKHSPFLEGAIKAAKEFISDCKNGVSVPELLISIRQVTAFTQDARLKSEGTIEQCIELTELSVAAGQALAKRLDDHFDPKGKN